MVFSSIPSYLLDPSNWQQPQNHQLIGSSGGGANPFIPHPPPPPPPQPHGSIRPGSMAERARLANIPMPEAALKCPRCDSTNTKFCYFNNYSLSQPRHFCKTCRRYWTRGGALRSVPVGGGCRRNKRSSSKSSSSKSPAATTAAGADPTLQANTSSNSNEDNNGLIPSSTTISNMNRSNGVGLGTLRSFMPPLSHITENFGGDHHLHHHHNMGLGGASYLMNPAETGFQGLTGLMGGPVLAADMGNPNTEPWRLMQNFPLFGGLEQPYQFHGGDLLNLTAGQHPIPCPRPKSSSSMLSQLAAGSVKMEEIIQTDLNLSRQLLGGNTVAGNEQWGTNPGSSSWTEFSGFSSSSTSNPL